MRKLILILAISVGIAILYGADAGAAPGNPDSAGLVPTEADRSTGRPKDAGHDR